MLQMSWKFFYGVSGPNINDLSSQNSKNRKFPKFFYLRGGAPTIDKSVPTHKRYVTRVELYSSLNAEYVFYLNKVSINTKEAIPLL